MRSFLLYFFVATLIKIIEEQVNIVIAKPQGVTSVHVKSDAKKNINVRCSERKPAEPARRAAKVRISFSDEETRAILHGYSRFRDKWDTWARIRDFYWVFNCPENVGRTSVQIKDRHRTMNKSGLIQLDQDNNIILQGVEEPESTTAAKQRHGKA